jgi:electron transport complex protein RnfA
MTYVLIFISAVFINNVVLSQILGICPFLGVSKKIDTAMGMGISVTFVIAIATLVTFLLMRYILIPLNLQFMQTISFILVIAALVQMVEIILKKVSPSLYQSLGVFLPLITTNCAVLGVAILVTQHDIYKESLLFSMVYAISTAIGFALALIIFAGIREHLNIANIPKAFKGMPVALVIAGILAMIFMGFTGIVQSIAP